MVERELHEGFFREFGIAPAEAAATPPSPTCAHYTHYLLALAHNAPYEVSVAALLPCFWIYWEVGKHLLEVARPGNPYQAWIDTYADEAFADGVRKVIAISDRVASRGDARHPRPDAPGLPPRLPAGMDVLGQRLSPGTLAGLARDPRSRALQHLTAQHLTAKRASLQPKSSVVLPAVSMVFF